MACLFLQFQNNFCTSSPEITPQFYKIEDLGYGKCPIYSIVLRLKNLSLKIL